MRTSVDVSQALLARAVPHEVVRLARRISCADELPGALGLVDGCVAVRLYAVSRGGRRSWAAVLVPSGADPDPCALAAALGSDDVRPATVAETNAVTGFPAGLVSPAGLPPGVEVLADAAIGRTDVVYAAAGEGGVAVGVRTRDLLVAAGARAATLSPAPGAAPRFADIVELDPRSAEGWAADPAAGPAAADPASTDPAGRTAVPARGDRHRRYG
ncbi:MAG TPA: YbaK/EbsC family protein [Mycobacteriales bacterium]|nr:YbaK/EbsC family protein [Mycobacteriales bacterium]